MTQTLAMGSNNSNDTVVVDSDAINLSKLHREKAKEKLQGRALFEAVGRPTKIVAPMVDQSELAWRILSRRYGATLAYTPMLHARLFIENEKYRRDMWSDMDGDVKYDRPLIVQFCANKPEEFLQAARLVAGKCDAVDLNLGCPQGIARRGRYGSFLQEDRDLIYKLINKLHNELSIPVTAKIRILDTKEQSLEYARHVLSAGAQFLTIHGRTREMKGQNTGVADWEILRYIRDNLPPETVFFANGNLLYQEDIARCLADTSADAVMSAEGNLYNPAIFRQIEHSSHQDVDEHDLDKEYLFPRIDKVLREYFEIVKSTPGEASKIALKSHVFKLCRSLFTVETDIRNDVGKTKRPRNDEEFEEWESIVRRVEVAVAPKIDSLQDTIIRGPLEPWGGRYYTVPYWRCQPYFRKINGVATNESKKRKAQDEL